MLQEIIEIVFSISGIEFNVAFLAARHFFPASLCCRFHTDCTQGFNLNGATIREVVSKAKMHPQIACGIVFEVRLLAAIVFCCVVMCCCVLPWSYFLSQALHPGGNLEHSGIVHPNTYCFHLPPSQVFEVFAGRSQPPQVLRRER